VAELDLRYPENKAKSETLEALALAASVHWEQKVSQAKDGPARAAHADAEAQSLIGWALACRDFDVPAVLDVRPKHPSEAVKYITKGPVKVSRDGDDVDGRDLVGTVPCPGCAEPCDPVFPEELPAGVRPVADWLLRARFRDGRPVRPAVPF
jgi:hypothetical protein